VQHHWHIVVSWSRNWLGLIFTLRWFRLGLQGGLRWVGGREGRGRGGGREDGRMGLESGVEMRGAAVSFRRERE
jgi:hypothetical protein